MGIGIRAGNSSFNGARNQIYVTRLLGLDRTVASGVQTETIRLQSASNVQVIRDTNKQLGGEGADDAVALAVVFRVRYSVDLPATGIDPAFRATKSIRERFALSTLSVKPGKAGQGYTMSRGETSIGLLLSILEDTRLCSQTMRAVRQATPGYAVTRDRNALNGDGIATASIDSTMLTAARNLICDEQRRVVASGTAITVPETGDQYEDVIVFPLTADGMHGPFTAGFSIEDLFSATNTWEFLLRPVFDTGIYAAGATCGDFSIEVSCAWRPGAAGKNRKGRAPSNVYGKVWQWNNALATVAQGTLQTLAGPAVQNHVEVGYPVVVYGENIDGSPVSVVDGNKYFFQEIIPGSGTALKCRLMPCNIPPSNFNTQQVYVQIGRENGENTFPLGGWNLAYGNESLLRWNSTFTARAVPGYFNSVMGAAYGTHCESQELPLFSSTGVRSAATSFCLRTPNGSLAYGTSFGAGTAVATIDAPKADTVTELDMGGLLHFPLAFSDRTVDGFFGTEVRPAGDLSGISVLTIGGFQLPQAKYDTTGAQHPANVNVVRILTDYAGFSTDPCACNHDMAQPAVFNDKTPNAALGIGLTASVESKKPTVL